MKTINKSILVIFIMTFLFHGCKKETLEQPVNDTNIKKSSLRKASTFDNVKLENGVLVFPNLEYLIRVLASLDNEVEEWNNRFYETYQHLTEDSLNLVAEKLNFDEQQPLVDFENHFGFISLRNKISTAENEWLLNDGENSENDPDNHFIADKTVRAILNEFSEVKIGGSYYKFTEEGYYEIIDGNFTTLALLRDVIYNVNSLQNFVHHKISSSEGCNSNKRKVNYTYNSSNTKRIKWVVSHWTYPWGRYAIAKTDNYEKKNNKWKKYKTYTVARVYGYISDVNNDGTADCSRQLQFNTSNGPAATGTVEEIKQKIPVSTKTKSGWINGYHYGAGGVTYTSTLTW